MLSTCASSMLQTLAIQAPIRGGIEIGTIGEIAKNVMYGPGVAAAYSLESQVAQYPRIVVGEKLTNYILATSNMTADDANKLEHVTNPEVFAIAASRVAKICKEMIIRDFDGHYIVHYLSPKVLEGMGGDVTETLVRHAGAFVVSQASFWQAQRNTKMSMRYSHMIQYFGAFSGLEEFNGD